MPWSNKEKEQEWYQRNKEKKREYNRRWRLEHREQRKIYQKQWRQEHREQKNAANRQWYRGHRELANRIVKRAKDKLKLEVLTYYGKGKCACVKCGFNDVRALSIDHIKGDGYLHREILIGGDFYRWLKKNNYPEGYQTLCMNCQFIKRIENKEYVGKGRR